MSFERRSRSKARVAIRQFTILALTVFGWAGAPFAETKAAIPEYTAKIVKTFPHDPAAFTEGLLYHNGYLYESTGGDGQSSIRQVELSSGKVLRQRNLDATYFGEGIVIWKDRLIELTWKNEIGFIYDVSSFDLRSDFHYPGQGWALTRDDRHIIMSDGTSDLRILDPGSLTEINRLHVTCEGHDIRNINELEWVKGEIYANIWLTNVIVRISPTTGKIVGLIDLTDLANAAVQRATENVLNGIAYDPAGDRLFVTGKLWPTLFQISLSRRTEPKNLCQTLH
jgi:glutaminyl-peptide cyclotransferase